jgi:hypothetical protein
MGRVGFIYARFSDESRLGRSQIRVSANRETGTHRSTKCAGFYHVDHFDPAIERVGKQLAEIRVPRTSAAQSCTLDVAFRIEPIDMGLVIEDDSFGDRAQEMAPLVPPAKAEE